MIKLILAEDQSLVRGALRALLQMESDIDVIAEAEDGEQALRLLKQHTVDILLTDIEMPNLSGIELIEKTRELYPNLKTVVVTTFGRAGYVKRALAAGVDGFLLKDSPSEELAAALRKVASGKKIIDPELAIAALGDCDPLSGKERKALKLAGEGKSTADIAAALFLSEGTVRNYLSEAIAKLNATNRIDAARIAQQKGWL
ncbi:response regulator transcription factor [Gilvimarinus sp. SDUM040013]|uniref:Response regulator transcription factor n=1 Tax=Gilvimarinus gilvus TaxID=3058038 RepID=A0ABU4RXQ0_9GAMM|nr:response regulator transcription factor [Gilvimarinus sp. SDUM040013]MDO3388695.1 response regulator transcription factor [Gilvimarinus sp. SDUM040013]MDX6849590.1 response regulator transcription factor [Gilvimarinus sp. SDUM040013]